MHLILCNSGAYTLNEIYHKDTQTVYNYLANTLASGRRICFINHLHLNLQIAQVLLLHKTCHYSSARNKSSCEQCWFQVHQLLCGLPCCTPNEFRAPFTAALDFHWYNLRSSDPLIFVVLFFSPAKLHFIKIMCVSVVLYRALFCPCWVCFT